MGGFVNGHWIESISAEEAARRDAGGAPQAPRPAAAPSPSAPAPSNLGNTNDQSVRADLRNQGYFIDDSGIYAPGAGDRVGDTFSGDQASRNTAPSPTRLPILNGHPVSPSNGFTGPQTDSIMYRGDPLYNQYFGQGTPGFSSTSRGANALPGALPNGQQTYAGAYGQPNTTPQLPQPAAQPQPAPSVSAPAPTGLNTVQTPETAAQALQRGQSQQYLLAFQQPNQDGTGYGPYSTPQQPQLTVHGRYVDGGNIIEKSTDQYGHEYFQTVGSANGQPNTEHPPAPAPAQPAAAPAAAPAAPATPTNPTTGAPTTPAQPVGTAARTVVGPDGKPYQLNLTDEDYQQVLSDQRAAADAQKQATQFAQGIEQGKVDIERSVAEWNKTYQQGLLQFQDRQLAVQQANQAMQIDLQKQALELQKQQQGMTVSLEREKLDVARQQMRGSGRRRLPQVRYK
jgi:hypothetical protein